jgi:hypothetical protein
MSLSPDLLNAVFGQPPDAAWRSIADRLWAEFSASLPSSGGDAEVVKRDRGLTELDNVLSGSAWDLWCHFESAVPRTSQAILDFWASNHGGKAVLILDGLSLRETPWLLEQAQSRGYKVHRAEVRGSELPAETTEFARSLGFSQRSSLENNGAGSAHKLSGAFTASCNLNWKDCVEMVGSQQAVVFWHHWPDEHMHHLAGPGDTLRKLVKDIHQALASDDFWSFIDRLTTGRRLVVTSDHGYASTGSFHDITDKEQVNHMKAVFKSGRSGSATGDDSAWVPPIDMALTTAHGPHQYVLGRRKWKSAAGYPTLQHGGLSLLEVFVPFVEISR